MSQAEQQQQQTVVLQQQHVQPLFVPQQRQPNPCRAAIPSMHMAMSITCLIVNCIIPGIGTIMASFGVFCCGNKGQPGGEKFGTFCINFWVGILQLILAPIGIGYVWAIMWGTAMVYLSYEYHNPDGSPLGMVMQPPGQNVVITSQAPGQQQQQVPFYPQSTVQQLPPQQGYPQQPVPQGYPQQPLQEKGYPQQPPPQYPQQPQQQPGYPQQPAPQESYTPQPEPNGDEKNQDP